MHNKKKFGGRPSANFSKAQPPLRFAAIRGAFSRSSGPRSNRRDIDPAVAYADLLPSMAGSKSNFAWACCPFHDDRNPSLCVNLVSGWYRCHSSSCNATGANIVGFVGRLLAIESQEARRYLEDHYG